MRPLSATAQPAACRWMTCSFQGRGGDELGAELTRALERTMYAGPSGRGALATPRIWRLSCRWLACWPHFFA